MLDYSSNIVMNDAIDVYINALYPVTPYLSVSEPHLFSATLVCFFSVSSAPVGSFRNTECVHRRGHCNRQRPSAA